MPLYYTHSECTAQDSYHRQLSTLGIWARARVAALRDDSLCDMMLNVQQLQGE